LPQNPQTPQNSQTPPSQRCADQLFLLGEMLSAAAQYMDLCGNSVAEESVSNLEVAYGRIYDLKEHHLDIGRRLGELELRLRRQLRLLAEVDSPAQTPKGKAARAT
jgi:hypothetical protein